MGAARSDESLWKATEKKRKGVPKTRKYCRLQRTKDDREIDGY